METMVKRPHEDVRGTDRDDWLLSLDERAIAHRDALMAMAEHLYSACLVGNPAPKVKRMMERISNPQIGDLVAEVSSIYRKRDPAHRVHGLGILLDRREEWAWSDEEWAEEVAAEAELGREPRTRPTDTIWYIQYGPSAADICRWEDCKFITVPASLDAFKGVE